jgi:hypothetical protein
MFSSFWVSLILFFFVFVYLFFYFSVVGWRFVCSLGGLTGLCTFHGGNEVCNGLRLGVETMVGRMVMWMKVIGLGEQAEQ